MHSIINLCRRVPLLPITIFAAFAVAGLWDWRPWPRPFWVVDPSVGQWIVIILVVYTVIDTLRGMIDDIRHGHVGVDVLAVVAILSTLAVQEYWASWAVVLMISSGEAIEEYAQAKAESNLTALMAAAPQTAHVMDLSGVGGRSAKPSGTAAHGTAADSHMRTVPVDQVRPGDVLRILPGETVPVDGELLSGTATLDLSNINGEPVPREVFAGARVMSGAVNGSTVITMRATELSRDSQYQRILELVQSAQNSRAAVVKTADLMAVPFTVISFVIACVAWIVSGVPTRFAQVLVLATPCPLLIAAPVAYMAGTGRLAKAGILVKTQETLENLGRVSHIFFDKTGTLTVKKPQVVRVDIPVGVVALPDPDEAVAATVPIATGSADSRKTGRHPAALNEDHILMFAGVVESYSVHILAKGIAKAGAEAVERLQSRYDAGQRQCPERNRPGSGLPERGRVYPVVRHISEDTGNGVSGEVNGHTVRVGRFDFVTEGMRGMGAIAAQFAALPGVDVAAAAGHAPTAGSSGFRSVIIPSASTGGTRRTPETVKRADKAASRARRHAMRDVLFPSDHFAALAPDEMAAYVAVDGRLVARIVLRDVPRGNSRESLARLRSMGVERLSMLTGDKTASATIIAEEVGLDDVKAELFPEGKVSAVREASTEQPNRQSPWDRALQWFAGKNAAKPVTMMVGDGVNDAPVLAAADIGMAITDGTSTAASESAQAVIMNDDIAGVPNAIAIARRTKRVMLQAVCLGLGLALVGMIAAAFDLIPVVIGAFMQEAIDVVSILWALTALIDRD
ncbi:ATPase [Bifidobacterium margollesii]|uniref:ATPase n=1 Tax=Bifidobacterium margollesii TaxID=2020964 RepID=A0A2N5J8S7_9BIFI|nr:HAD-IC family P-type ATPase [Bifidobacterium margollesii]PLS30591.1 ATPase [Bifidobacterium margollesii]